MLINELKPYLKTRLVIVGLGNTLRGDDGAGIILARELKKKFLFPVFEAGTVLENYLNKIIKENPQTLLIIDTLDFGGSPGQIKIFKPQDLNTINLGFTHNSSLVLSINYLQSQFDMNIIILTIQPKILDFKKRITKEVKNSIKLIKNFFSENLLTYEYEKDKKT